MVNGRGRARLALVLALAIFAVLAGGGCKKASVSIESLPVTCQADVRVFTLFAGLNAAGYDEERGAEMDPLRLQVREALASADPKVIERFGALLRQGTPESITQIVLKDIGDAPGFGYKEEHGIVADVSAGLKTLWAAGAETLYGDTTSAQADAAAVLNGPAAAAVRGTLGYCHEEVSPFTSVFVIPNQLASHGFSYRYLKSDKSAIVVVGPAGASQIPALTREVFYLYFGETLFHQLSIDGDLSRFDPVLEKAKAVKLIGDRYFSAQGFAEECLVRALVARLVPPGDPAAAMDAEYNAGFALTPAFYEALAAYETGDKALAESVPELLAAVNVTDLLNRMETAPPTGQ